MLTFASVTVAFVLYGVLAALENGLLRRPEALSTPRLVTTEAASYLNMLPTRYRNRIVVLDGVAAATYLSPFRGRHEGAAAPFAQYAVHAASFLDVYPELLLDPASRDRWLAIRTGAIVGVESDAAAPVELVGDHRKRVRPHRPDQSAEAFTLRTAARPAARPRFACSRSLARWSPELHAPATAAG